MKFSRMDNRINDYLKENFLSACLESFGIKKQFLELVFTSSKHEEIKFFVDCRVYSNDESIRSLVEPLKTLDKDIYTLAYLLNANLKLVEDFMITSDNKFEVRFSNNYCLVFDFNSEIESTLSITFKEQLSVKEKVSIDFEYGEAIEFNNS